MSERELRNFVADLDDDAFELKAEKPISAWAAFFEFEGNQYLIPSIREWCLECVNAWRMFSGFAGLSFFPYPYSGTTSRVALFPDLNVDRGGDGTREQMRAYWKAQNELEQLVRNLLNAYVAYRRTVKEQLTV